MLSFLSLLLFGLWANPVQETVPSVTGAPLCCSEDYWKCRKRCAPDGCLECAAPEPCLRRCENAACQAGACGQAKRTDGKEMRSDGRLTGPGEIRFQAFNKHTEDPPLQVLGLVYGKDPQGIPARLQMTEVVTVLPGSDSRFSLRVSPEQFAQWTGAYGVLTIGLTYPDEETAARWRFENLLTPGDIQNAMPGEFLVKGAFHPQ